MTRGTCYLIDVLGRFLDNLDLKLHLLSIVLFMLFSGFSATQ